MLEILDLHVSYGRVRALHGVSLNVTEGAIVAVLGPNGAGKSTLLRTISGLLRSRSGEIRFQSRPIHKLSPTEIVRLGISHVPEGRGLISDFTVLENLKLATYIRRDRNRLANDFERLYALFPVIRERQKQLAGTLSGGEQQMLAIARALLTRPRLLLIDEMSLGLAPLVIVRLFDILRTINGDGTTILLVEQNARLALQVASHAYVLENGRVVIEGRAKDLRHDPRIEASYLGISRAGDPDESVS